jgi:hypothetical protein
VAGFVAEDAHAGGEAAAFDFEHLPAFELPEARVGEIEGDGDARAAVGAEPFVRQPAVGAEGDAAEFELVVEAGDALLELGAFDLDAEIAEAQFEQLFVGEFGPPRLEELAGAERPRQRGAGLAARARFGHRCRELYKPAAAGANGAFRRVRSGEEAGGIGRVIAICPHPAYLCRVLSRKADPCPQPLPVHW